MKIQIFTRSCNPDLYEKAKSFWPSEIKAIQYTDFNYTEGAMDFLWKVVFEAEKYAIVIDEDFFIYDFDKIKCLLFDLILANKICCGIPEKGFIDHRNFTEKALNPFFLILDCERIRFEFINKKIKLDISFDLVKEEIKWFGTLSVINPHPEPFHGFFMWLESIKSPLTFPVKTMEDGIATDTGFGIHTWYSRDYTIDPAQKDRIDNLYLLANERFINNNSVSR
jgi:hypothetical protein